MVIFITIYRLITLWVSAGRFLLNFRVSISLFFLFIFLDLYMTIYEFFGRGQCQTPHPVFEICNSKCPISNWMSFMILLLNSISSQRKLVLLIVLVHFWRHLTLLNIYMDYYGWTLGKKNTGWKCHLWMLHNGANFCPWYFVCNCARWWSFSQ